MKKENRILNIILKSALAGLLIGLAGIVYLQTKDKTIGAVLFSVGLTSIILLGGNLYTGKIGYINSKQDILDLLIIIVVNFIVVFLVGLAYRFIVGPTEAMATRLEKSWYRMLFDAILCGMLIYLAVELYRKSKNIFPIVLCVVTFILAGFEHCVADGLYFITNSTISLKSALYVLIAIFGNAIGSLLVRVLQKGIKIKEE